MIHIAFITKRWARTNNKQTNKKIDFALKKKKRKKKSAKTQMMSGIFPRRNFPHKRNEIGEIERASDRKKIDVEK